jgi:hypothetical protein
MFEQRSLDIVGLPDENPLARVRDSVNSGFNRRIDLNRGEGKGTRRDSLKGHSVS